MSRNLAVVLIFSLLLVSYGVADEIKGTYIEARTCQVYTGPCFANGEVGLAGKHAVMTWNVEEGSFSGVDLAGLGVAVVVQSSHTLGFHGLADAKQLKGIIFVDGQASTEQTAALVKFAQAQTGLSDRDLLSVRQATMHASFDRSEVTGSIEVENVVKLVARKARRGDCICSNESAYYPPLVKLAGFVPGVTIEGEVTARRLGARWSIPDSRTAYLGTFELDTTPEQLASLR